MGGGYPILFWPGGTPILAGGNHPDLAMGYPHYGVPPSSGTGVPPPRPGLGWARARAVMTWGGETSKKISLLALFYILRSFTQMKITCKVTFYNSVLDDSNCSRAQIGRKHQRFHLSLGLNELEPSNLEQNEVIELLECNNGVKHSVRKEIKLTQLCQRSRHPYINTCGGAGRWCIVQHYQTIVSFYQLRRNDGIT